MRSQPQFFYVTNESILPHVHTPILPLVLTSRENLDFNEFGLVCDEIIKGVPVGLINATSLKATVVLTHRLDRISHR